MSLNKPKSSRWWWIRAAYCEIFGHCPDGVVNKRAQYHGQQLLCKRRCGSVMTYYVWRRSTR